MYDFWPLGSTEISCNIVISVVVIWARGRWRGPAGPLLLFSSSERRRGSVVGYGTLNRFRAASHYLTTWAPVNIAARLLEAGSVSAAARARDLNFVVGLGKAAVGCLLRSHFQSWHTIFNFIFFLSSLFLIFTLVIDFIFTQEMSSGFCFFSI
jgi:hypothetical protein